MITLDADKYLINIPYIEKLLQDKNPKEIAEHMGLVAIATNVPIIVCCIYAAELCGASSFLSTTLKINMEFYGVNQVLYHSKPCF